MAIKEHTQDMFQGFQAALVELQESKDKTRQLIETWISDLGYNKAYRQLSPDFFRNLPVNKRSTPWIQNALRREGRLSLNLKKILMLNEQLLMMQ